MSSGRDEWASLKTVLKREGKKGFKLARDSWRESRSSSSENFTASSDIQGDASTTKSTQKRDVELNPTSDFQYDPLPGQGFIRLLTILPGEDEELIQLQLSAVKLDDSHDSYESLSYVWGNPKQPKKLVIVNGASLEIYESLNTFLMNIRPSTTSASRVVWVDAICINQNDMIERNQQIPLMDIIYQSSMRTVVWLGAETEGWYGAEKEGGKELFDMLHDLAQDARALKNSSTTTSLDKVKAADDTDSASLPAILQRFLRREPVQSPKRDLYLARIDIWSILRCEWWYRAWTLQEILLSTSITLVQGTFEIDWQDFCLAVDHGLRMHIWVLMDSGTFVAEEIIPYLSIKSLQLQLGLHGDSAPDRPDFGAEGVLRLLEKCRQREAKDPRDKIYAICGIIKAVQKMRPGSNHVHSIVMNPDYTNPVVYVYRMLTQQLIETTQSLDVLGVCPQSTRRGLLSWVTDWSISDSFAVPLTRDSLDRPRHTHAARGTTARARFPPDAVTLVLRGHEVTSVKEVSEVLRRVHFTLGTRESIDKATDSETGGFRTVLKEAYEEAHRDLHAQASYFHTLLEWERFAATMTAQNPGGDAASVYWKTLCAGTYDPKDPDKTEAMYQEWLKVLVNLRNNEKRFGSFSSKINPMMYTMQSMSWNVGYPEFTPYLECAIERRFGWCENGWLCLLPEETHKDDRIVLVEGGKVPLVLRPDGDGYYMFVGEAYIHGIMDGEAFRPELCQDIKVC
ncbi:hypothetical protein Daus18300_010492 [Diaporthe australafricana]|uniref:Heterokaryon incompatibility domain-containing protein n=1 Tax=Diaporthe australafricana TaxID=127596 RepID=A0ABR3WAG1_9PEZI